MTKNAARWICTIVLVCAWVAMMWLQSNGYLTSNTVSLILAALMVVALSSYFATGYFFRDADDIDSDESR